MNMQDVKKTENQKLRDSSMELLRIVAMIMIMACHFATHGGFSFTTDTVTLPRLWWYFIEMGGNFGTDVYVLISGYYLIKESNGKIFDLKKILKFWGQVFFYSVLIYVVFGATGVSSFSFSSLLETIFPITFSSWWFASTYFVLYLIHPFLNILLHGLDRGKYQKFLVMLVILWCIIPTFTGSTYQSNSLIWFITLYCISGYVRMYGFNSVLTSKHYLLLWFVFSGLRYLSGVALITIGTKISFAADNALFFYGTQSVLTLLSALSLFMFFEKKNIGSIRWINIAASATFGVYLIHDSNIIRPFLWLTVFKNAQYQNSIFLIPYSIMAVALVYVCCTMIDLGRKYLIEKPYMKLVNRYADKIQKPFELVIDFFKNIVFGRS